MTVLSVAHVNKTDIVGGAARAAYRIHRALLDEAVDSEYLVDIKESDDWTVTQSLPGGAGKARSFARREVDSAVSHVYSYARDDGLFRSSSLIPGRALNVLEAGSHQVVNLHWVNQGCLSIKQISRIRKPLVWTLHDMWPFAGAVHYDTEEIGAEWRAGFASRGWRDLDRSVFLRKKRHWRNPIHLVATSSWLASRAAESPLTSSWPIDVIPNPLPTARFKPLPAELARSAFGLPQDKPLILFGALAGTKNYVKGGDLLVDAVAKVAEVVPDAELVIFGQSEQKSPPTLPLPVTWVGPLADDVTLALLYSAVTVTVVPSRAEAFGQTVTESHACGTPVVAFDAGGPADLVSHGITGYLATAFDTDDLARGIVQCIRHGAQGERLSTAARRRALELWSPPVVAKRYVDLYSEVLLEASRQ